MMINGLKDTIQWNERGLDLMIIQVFLFEDETRIGS